MCYIDVYPARYRCVHADLRTCFVHCTQVVCDICLGCLARPFVQCNLLINCAFYVCCIPRTSCPRGGECRRAPLARERAACLCARVVSRLLFNLSKRLYRPFLEFLLFRAFAHCLSLVVFLPPARPDAARGSAGRSMSRPFKVIRNVNTEAHG